jgi:iron complex outermembrane receptor protein
MKKLFLLLAVSFLSIQIMHGQDVNSDTMVYRYPGEIVISASRMAIPLSATPYSTTIVDSTNLQTMPRSTAIDEAMRLVPGVKVDNQANGERVHLSIRGQGILTESGIRSIKILLDELPINDPTGFAPDFFDVDLNSVDRIEVLRGPSASLYGGGAAGGILNILTKNSPNSPLSGEASADYGSNNFWKGFGQFGGNSGDVNYRVSFSRTAGDGYRVHTHFFENNVYAKATYTPSSSIELTPIMSWTDTRHENPEGLSLAQYNQDPTLPNDDAVPYDEHMEMNRTTNGLTGLIHVQDNQEIRFNGYIKHSVYTEANNHVFDHQTLTTPGTSLQYTFKSGSADDRIKNKFSVGTDLQWQTIDEHSDSNNHSIEMDSLWSKQQIWQRGMGFFAIDMIDLGNDWNFMGSVRLDKIHNELNDLLKNDSSDASGSTDFSNVTGRIGVTYSPERDLNLYGSWGQGFIPPSTEEVGTNPDSTLRYRGFNSGLVPATSNSYELGARGTLNRNLEYELSGYYTTTTNDFDRYRIQGRGNGEEGTFYRNIGATKRYGLELFSEYRPINSLTIQLAYTYSHFQYSLSESIPILMDDTSIHKYTVDGSWLPNSPQHQLVIDVNYDLIPELSLGLSTTTLSEAYIDGANLESEAVQGYTLLSGRIAYHWKAAGFACDLTCQVRNITDQKYVAFSEPDTGGNSYQPGTGREFFGGIKIRF